MAAGKYDFTIEQGSTTAIQFILKDGNGNLIDITGYSARMQLRESLDAIAVICDLSSSLQADGSGLMLNGISQDLPLTSGSIGLYISAATSSAFTFNAARYALELTQGSYVNRVIQGTIRLDKEVVR